MDESKDAAVSFPWMPAGCEALADGEYDVIILGTGLTECIISGLLSVEVKAYTCLRVALAKTFHYGVIYKEFINMYLRE